MAYDVFLKLDGIQGESTDEQHPGWIEILNYDMDVGQTVSRTASSAGGATAERAGTHFDTITLELCRAGGDKLRFMQYTFTNCMLTSLFTAGDAEFPEDDVAFNYGQIQWRYTLQQRAGGWAGGNIAAGWSLEKNCPA